MTQHLLWLSNALDALAPGWVGSIIGLLGIVAAVVMYFLSRQRTLLVYRHTGERLLGLKDSGLPAHITVQYRGQHIPRLTRSIVVIWNAGEKTIAETDLIKSDPLRVALREEGEVLSATVLKASRDVIEFRCSQDPSRPKHINLGFAFLDMSDGAVIEVLHTSESRYVDVLGSIRGIPRGVGNLGRIVGRRAVRSALPLKLSPRWIGWIALALGVTLAIFGVLLPFSGLIESSKTSAPVGAILAIAGGVYILLGVMLLVMVRRRYPAVLHVDEFE